MAFLFRELQDTLLPGMLGRGAWVAMDSPLWEVVGWVYVFVGMYICICFYVKSLFTSEYIDEMLFQQSAHTVFFK